MYTAITTSPTPVTTTTPAPGNGSAALWGVLLIGAMIWAVGYQISIRLHPYRACRACNGTGRKRGSIFTSGFRACDRCGGASREHRPFANAPYVQNEDKRGGRRE